MILGELGRWSRFAVLTGCDCGWLMDTNILAGKTVVKYLKDGGGAAI